MTKTLILGASGATGKNLVNQLLAMGQSVKIIVRSTASIPEGWKNNTSIEIIEGNVSEIKLSKMQKHLQDCSAVASCLGHNMSFKGIYGKPKKLVTEAIQLVCASINNNEPPTPVKVVLMNTAGNRNRDKLEPISSLQKIILAIIRFTVPPHRDNELAADYLRVQIGQNHKNIRWIVVRPDTLVDQSAVCKYEVHPSPTRSAIFNAGKTSRINVGNFMATLITDEKLWKQWSGQMPVLYNSETP